MRGTLIEQAQAMMREPRALSRRPSGLHVFTSWPMPKPYDYPSNNTIITTTTAADQLILEYRTPGGVKKLSLLFLYVSAIFTAISAVATILGTASVQTSLLEKFMIRDFVNNTSSAPDIFVPPLAPPLEFFETKFLRVVCTPAVLTSITWRALMVVRAE